MAINFPNSPSIGQVYEFGDYRYTYDGVKWTSVLKYGLAAAKIASETPPPNPEAGLMWFVPSTGESYIWYEDEDSGQWIEERPSIGGPIGQFSLYGKHLNLTSGDLINTGSASMPVDYLVDIDYSSIGDSISTLKAIVTLVGVGYLKVRIVDSTTGLEDMTPLNILWRAR